MRAALDRGAGTRHPKCFASTAPQVFAAGTAVQAQPDRVGQRFLLLHAVDRRLGMLAEVLNPCALDAGVVLGRLDQVDEAGDRHLETTPELLVGDLPLVVQREVGAR